MRRSQDLLYNVTVQSLLLMVRTGRPSSATFSVFRNYSDDEATAEFSGSATVDSVSTTVNASSGMTQADPQKINLASTTGIVLGRKYRLQQNAFYEWVEPVEIQASFVRVRYPLQNDYTSGATFQSTWLSGSVDATWIANKNNLSDLSDNAVDYRVKWTVVVSGVTTVVYSHFDVVRSVQSHGLDIDDVNNRIPGLHDSLPVEYRQEEGRPLLDTAWDAVVSHFASLQVDVNELRDDYVLDELVLLRAIRVLAEGGWHPRDMDAIAFVELAQRNYNTFFDQHYAVMPKHQIQNNYTSASAQTPAYGSGAGSLPPWSK